MCGIAGFTFEDRDLIRKMCDSIVHRGPDGEGYYLNAGISLGHRRLKIIDLKTGDQPIFNEDGSIVVVYNGEIYNYRRLRERLEETGHRFTTAADTEVIVHSYEEYGTDCVQHLDGMFAFALYNTNTGELVLARDRYGIKPLHYTVLGDGTFLFASEIKALLQYTRVPRIMDPQSLHMTINLRYIPGDRTMFSGIRRLPPAHVMVVQGGERKISRFWRPEFTHTSYPEEYYIKKLRKLLETAVSDHLVADVPVGVMLSGGIDSSTVVALASRMSDDPIQTFCMGFGHPNDEIQDAAKVAEYFGTDHHELIVADNLLRDYPTMIWYADEPKRNLYPYYISGMVSRYVKSALGGLGSDELFGGYVFKYNFIRKIENIRKKAIYEKKLALERVADQLIQFQTRYGDIVDDGHLDYLEMMRAINRNVDLYLITQTQDKVFDREYLEKIYGESLLTEPIEPIQESYRHLFDDSLPFMDQVIRADFLEKMTDDFLLVDDRMNMAHSLESRVPFLDRAIVDFGFSVPTNIKLKDPNGKYLLRQAVKDILPKEVLCKKKQGFASGTYEVYLREGREIAENTLLEGDLVKEGYIRREYLEKILTELPNPKLELHYGALWNILTCEIWYQIYIVQGGVRPSLNINALT